MTLIPYFSVFMYGDNDSIGGEFLSQNMVKVPNANCLVKGLLYAIVEWVGCVWRLSQQGLSLPDIKLLNMWQIFSV